MEKTHTNAIYLWIIKFRSSETNVQKILVEKITTMIQKAWSETSEKSKAQEKSKYK